MIEQIELLKKYGHFDNPAVKATGVIAPDEWNHLTLNDQRVKAAVNSYQQFMFTEYQELVFKHHNRAGMYDGELGPATDELLRINRCECPDYLPEDQEKLIMSASGSGSWPVGCYDEEPDIHSVKFHVNTSRQPRSIANWWDDIEETVINAYAEMGMLLVRVEDINRAHITVKWEPLSGSTIGLAELPGSGRCGVRVFCKLDPSYGPNANQVMQLWAHELGHNMNSGHISGDPIMHPSMTNQTWNKSFKGTPFGRRLSGYFGGEPVGPSDPPEPIPPQEEIKLNFDDRRVEIKIGNQQVRKYARVTDYPEL